MKQEKRDSYLIPSSGWPRSNCFLRNTVLSITQVSFSLNFFQSPFKDDLPFYLQLFGLHPSLLLGGLLIFFRILVTSLPYWWWQSRLQVVKTLFRVILPLMRQSELLQGIECRDNECLIWKFPFSFVFAPSWSSLAFQTQLLWPSSCLLRGSCSSDSLGGLKPSAFLVRQVLRLSRLGWA